MMRTSPLLQTPDDVRPEGQGKPSSRTSIPAKLQDRRDDVGPSRFPHTTDPVLRGASQPPNESMIVRVTRGPWNVLVDERCSRTGPGRDPLSRPEPAWAELYDSKTLPDVLAVNRRGAPHVRRALTEVLLLEHASTA